jgi:hypothetical protein
MKNWIIKKLGGYTFTEYNRTQENYLRACLDKETRHMSDRIQMLESLVTTLQLQLHYKAPRDKRGRFVKIERR